jgi:hypothetical protein
MPEHQSQATQQRGAVPLLAVLIFLLLLMLLIWCLWFRGGRGKSNAVAAAYTVLPAGCPDSTPPSDTTQLGACLQGLTFDTVPALGDEQRLMVRGPLPGPFCHGDTTHSCRYGLLAKIEPVMGAQDYTESALHQGRIIARMFIRAGETDSYPKLGLVLHDTTYWYVNTAIDSSFFVARPQAGDSLLATVRPLEMEPHPGRFQQAVARWLWFDNDEKSQGACGQSCCK